MGIRATPTKLHFLAEAVCTGEESAIHLLLEMRAEFQRIDELKKVVQLYMGYTIKGSDPIQNTRPTVPTLTS